MKKIIPMILISFSLEAGWHDRKCEGWVWHEEKEIPIEETVPENESPQNQNTSEDPLDALKKVQENLERKKARAVLERTPEAVGEYIEEQYKMMQNSAEFSLVWQQFILNHPEFNGFLDNPMTAEGVKVTAKSRRENLETLINELSEEYGLFFFYEGNSKASQSVSWAVADFIKKYNWKAIPVSRDGAILSNFLESKVDNGISESMNVSVFPSVYLVNPENGDIVPIAYGIISLETLESNIAVAFNERLKSEK